MALEATRRELGELYAFFRLLADGEVRLGTPSAQQDTAQPWPVARIQRTEHDGIRHYYVEPEAIRVVCGTCSADGSFLPDAACEPRTFARDDFGAAAQLVLGLLRQGPGDPVEVPQALETFLDTLRLYDLEARTDDRTDLSVSFWHPAAPLTGLAVRCRLSPLNPLLDGGRTANLKLEQGGIRFASPTVNKINALPASPDEVAERMRMIARLGGNLRFSDVADRVFRCNLQMIDLHFPRLLAEMVRTMHLESITRTPELTERIKELNPLKIKDELISKHGYYEAKVKQFLLALALGMRPAKIYNGTGSALEGMLLVDGGGRTMLYHHSEPDNFAAFLYANSRLEKGPLDKDRYGYLERENGTYYFKLNAKIGLTKR